MPERTQVPAAGAKSPGERQRIAAEIVRRIDTVTLATGAEVADIYQRAQVGEFDTIFDTIFDNEAPHAE